MTIISHRGNLEGPTDSENCPLYIKNVLKRGFHCEVDVWYVDGDYWLGHDEPMYSISSSFLKNAKLWCHAKNKEALEKMSKQDNIHFFWHEQDDYTFTSKGIIWCYPGKKIIKDSICVKPEIAINGKLDNCRGVCSDFPLLFG